MEFDAGCNRIALTSQFDSKWQGVAKNSLLFFVVELATVFYKFDPVFWGGESIQQIQGPIPCRLIDVTKTIVTASGHLRDRKGGRSPGGVVFGFERSRVR
jgi:hypothetical protein